MIILRFILILYLFVNVSLIGQNFILNGDFEIYKDCPKSYLSKKRFLPMWYSPTKGTPDYFNECSKGLANVPNNFAGKIYSKNGKGYIGFIVADLTKTIGIDKYYSREYVGTRLNQSLKKDTLYCISLFISHASYSKIRVNQIGIYLSGRKINKAIKNELKYIPQVKYDISQISYKEWGLLSATYKANGNEQFIIIGNFDNDDNLSWIKIMLQTEVESPFGIGAYYYIDNVSLVEIEDQSECICNLNENLDVDSITLSNTDSTFENIKPGEIFILAKTLYPEAGAILCIPQVCKQR